MNKRLRGYAQLIGCAFISGISLMCVAMPAHAGPTITSAVNTNYVQGLRTMAAELSATMLHQLSIVGRFFDGRQHLETQQTFQRLSAEAYKDYHPSETMCRFGSYMSSIALTENKGQMNKMALTKLSLKNRLSNTNGLQAISAEKSRNQRIDHFKKAYCDINDNNNSLIGMCRHEEGTGAIDPNRANMDINYLKTIAHPLTLDVDFMDESQGLSKYEEDVIAMMYHLYDPAVFDVFDDQTAQDSTYQYFRTLIAMHNIARNSYITHIGHKSRSVVEQGMYSGWNFMKAMLKETTLRADDVHTMLGDFPSYYAQMDVLTKKIYQNPDFYTNLYDKPANLERISAAMEAFQLMQLRDHYESQTRKEMMFSMMLQEKLMHPIDLAGAELK